MAKKVPFDWLDELAKELPKAAGDIGKQMEIVRRLNLKRIRMAGKHVCVRKYSFAVRRMTGRGDRILKRPVVVKRFYECKICGRDMTEVGQ